MHSSYLMCEANSNIIISRYEFDRQGRYYTFAGIDSTLSLTYYARGIDIRHVPVVPWWICYTLYALSYLWFGSSSSRMLLCFTAMNMWIFVKRVLILLHGMIGEADINLRHFIRWIFKLCHVYKYYCWFINEKCTHAYICTYACCVRSNVDKSGLFNFIIKSLYKF